MSNDPGPVPEPSDATTLVDVLAAYQRAGWDVDLFVTDEGRLRCGNCRQESDPANVALSSLRRLEGASDPADMLAVLALACPHCRRQGTAVVHYGPEVSEGEAAVLLAVEDERGEHR